MNTLSTITRSRGKTDTYTYDSYGNIASKTGIGDYEYSSSSKPHAVVAVDNTAGIIPEHTQSVTYNAWGKRTQTTSTLEFRRGFTGHEHIDVYDLINMNSAIEREHGEFNSPVPSVSRMGEANGRMYDPLIARFLSRTDRWYNRWDRNQTRWT